MKGKHSNFTELNFKTHKGEPGPGTYKFVESAFAKLSKSPTMHKSKR